MSASPSTRAPIRASTRERRLEQAGLEVRSSPGVTVVPPGRLVPSGGGDSFVVFSAYWNRWRAEARRAVLEPPASIPLPPGLEPGRVLVIDFEPGKGGIVLR